MIISSLERKESSSSYIVIIDNKKYILDEEVVLKYRLFPNNEISDDIIDCLIDYNSYMEYYNKALNYSIKYAKPSKRIIDYLLDKGCNQENALKIVEELMNKKILNDNILCKNQINYLITNYNGILMIKKKLYEKGFSKEVIDKEMEKLDYDLYYEYLNKCYIKNKDKYNKYDSNISKIKLKGYLLQRGYIISDLNNIDIKLQ